MAKVDLEKIFPFFRSKKPKNKRFIIQKLPFVEIHNTQSRSKSTKSIRKVTLSITSPRAIERVPIFESTNEDNNN